jgi:hypothetical protein
MSLSRSVGVSNTRTSPTAIAFMPCLDLRVSEPNVIYFPFINVPAEVFEQELAQGHSGFQSSGYGTVLAVVL